MTRGLESLAKPSRSKKALETDSLEKHERIFWLDATRVVAIIGVVLLHVAAPHLLQFRHSAAEDWHIANIIDALTRPAVPLFFMVSGALLLGRHIEISQLKHRLTRLIIPLVAWSIIYLALRSIIDPNVDVIGLALRTPIAPAMYHLWFLYALIGLYLCLPLVGPAIQAASPTHLRYGLGLWLLASGIIPIFERILGTKSSFELSTMAGYMGYMVLGRVLAQARRPSRQHAFAAIVLIGVGYSITALGTALITTHYGRFFSGFYNYLSPNVMLFSSGVFVIMRVAFEGRQSRFFRTLADISFGIYLCHVAVLTVADKMFEVRGWWIIPFAVLVFTASAVMTLAIRRVGLAKVLAP